MKTWEICGQSLVPGEKRQTMLSIPMAEGTYDVPATLICGAVPGKTLLVTASIHSGEYIGIPAVIRTAKALDPARVSGNVLMIHCVNMSGTLSHRYREVPEDGYNLNNNYPGDGDGSPGQRIQAWFVREIFPKVDFIFDLHGGSPEEVMTPLMFCPHAEKVAEVSHAAAMALNVEFLIESWATSGEYSYAANFMDVPGLLLERGNGVYCTEADIAAEIADLRLLLDHLGIYPAEPGTYDPALRRRVFNKTVYLESEVGGLWYPRVEKDTDVRAGELLGTVEDYFGNTLAEYRAVEDGHVLYYTRGLAVNPGDALVAYALLSSEE